MLETSFITLTGTKIQYFATNVRWNLGFHLPSNDRAALGGVPLGLITLSSWHPCRVHVILIQIYREIRQKNVLYPVSLLPRAT